MWRKENEPSEQKKTWVFTKKNFFVQIPVQCSWNRILDRFWTRKLDSLTKEKFILSFHFLIILMIILLKRINSKLCQKIWLLCDTRSWLSFSEHYKNPPLRLLVGWSVGRLDAVVALWFIYHNFIFGREVTVPSSYWTNCIELFLGVEFLCDEPSSLRKLENRNYIYIVYAEHTFYLNMTLWQFWWC